MSSRQWEFQQERNNDEKVAKYLGLTYEEFVSLEPVVEEQESDEGLIYSYLVTFEAQVPADLAARISELNDDGEVLLPPGFFETEEQYPDWPQG